jgi:hypothetical protein
VAGKKGNGEGTIRKRGDGRWEAPLPFQLTPPAPSLRFRTRFGSPVSVEQAMHRLPRLAAQIASQLQTQRQTVGTLTLTIWWESGGVERAQMTLREPTHEQGLLTRHVSRLLTSLLRSPERPTAEQIDRLEIQATDLAPERTAGGAMVVCAPAARGSAASTAERGRDTGAAPWSPTPPVREPHQRSSHLLGRAVRGNDDPNCC